MKFKNTICVETPRYIKAVEHEKHDNAENSTTSLTMLSMNAVEHDKNMKTAKYN